MIRRALVPIFALALIISTGGVARAETDAEEQPVDPGVELFRQALADYRSALAELRELCTADGDTGVTTARRRAPKELTACQRGMKELRTFLVEVRKTAHWVTERHAVEKEARRAAKAEEKLAKERAEAEAREDAERQKAEKAEKAEKAKRDEAARLAEKARQAEKAKQQERQKANDSTKQKASYERELADLRRKLQTALSAWAGSERAANEYRVLAEAKTGDERAKYEQKALAERTRAAELQAMAKKLQAKIADYEKRLRSVPQTTDVQKMAQKLRDQVRSLEDAAAHKRGLEQDAIDKANEYRAVSNERDGAERDKYLAKAAELDRQADEWGRLASEYEDQRDRAQAELDALGL